jgi:uncharacterized repeat protein (TIGR01451 family)
VKNHPTRKVLMACVVSLAVSSCAYAATNGSSSAFGESVLLKILPALGSPVQISSGPLPSVAGAASPPYSSTNQVASADVALGLLLSGGLRTGLLTVNAASNIPNSNSASANSTVNNSQATLGGLVGLTADVIQSSARAAGSCGALSSTGSTVLANAKLNGATVTASAAPNTVLLDAGGVRIVLNEQIAAGNGTTDTSLTVNAIHISLDNAPLGLGLVGGDIIIAQSTASMHCTLGSADLAISKIGPATAHVGDKISFRLYTTNHGPDTATGVVVTDILPPGLTFVSADTVQIPSGNTEGSCSGTTTVTCTLGSLNPGAIWRVEIFATVNGPNIANTGTVRGNEEDPNPANNSSTATPTVN